MKAKAQERMTASEYLARYGNGAKQGKKRGEMNKTEAAFAADELEPLKLDGVLADYKYEAIKLRLASGAFYTPDFVGFPAKGRKLRIMIYEVKGFVREAAMVRIKVAAEMYPMFHFMMVFKRKKKDGGGWQYRHF